MNDGEKLVSALIGLVRAMEGNESLVTNDTERLILDALATLYDGSLNERSLEYFISEIRREKNRLCPACSLCAMPCGRTSDYDMSNLKKNGEEIREKKLEVLSKIEKAAKYGGKEINNKLLYKALYYIGLDDSSLLSYTLILNELDNQNAIPIFT